ncbi:MAG: polysaccharide biosynthesis protein [Actinobacteria bacterium]|nr:polysaccharide biosynthesis protein [Actinomycetota bacterium]
MVVAAPENEGRRVLITGGTGSFGSTVTRGLLAGPIDEIRILSRDEAKQDDMRRRLGDSRVRFYVGDVRDAASVREVMDGVDYVFHAAALKQVPSCEFFPLQAVATNVQGSDNVIRAAHDCGVKSVVCLSTDKAVYPVNAMGLSKAMMERVACAFSRNHPESSTTVSVTRYGNVMYSRGSVIPLFVEQVRAGKPMTITNPRMTRFLMSLDESVALVQYAFENAQPGDLFIRKAPASTIEDLAKAVALVMGVEPQIQIIGTRHGEKLYESLLSREEMAEAEDCGEYYRVPLDARSLDYGMFVEEGGHQVEHKHDYTSHNTNQLSVEEVAELLTDLPEMRAALAKVSV